MLDFNDDTFEDDKLVAYKIVEKAMLHAGTLYFSALLKDKAGTFYGIADLEVNEYGNMKVGQTLKLRLKKDYGGYTIIEREK